MIHAAYDVVSARAMASERFLAEEQHLVQLRVAIGTHVLLVAVWGWEQIRTASKLANACARVLHRR